MPTTDTQAPTATALILSDTNLAAGETTTLTLTFSEAVTGVTNSSVQAPNGTLSTLSSADGGINWTGTFTPDSGNNSTMNQLSLGLSGIADLANNPAQGGTFFSGYYAIDTAAPTATIGISDTALHIGTTPTVSIDFSEAVSGFDVEDLTVSHGTLSALTSTDGLHWTATLTPDAGVQSNANLITLNNAGVTDTAGNAVSGTVASPNYTIDTQRPTATITLSDSALKAGDTAQVTIAFNEAVTGLSNNDVTVANGTLSTLSSSDEGITWTGTFIPSQSAAAATNVITLDNTAVMDAAGNHGAGTTDSANYAIDSVAPTATMTLSDTDLKTGETATLTISFSEAVTGLTNAAVTVSNGTLSTVSSTDGGHTWTGTFTPANNVTTTGALMWLNTTGVTDLVGNSGNQTVTSGYYSIDTQDTQGPTATITIGNPVMATGDTSSVTITFNEVVTSLTAEDLTVDHGTLSALSSSDEGLTWTGTLTPDAGVEIGGNVITLNNAGIADSLGNVGVGVTMSAAYEIDTKAPTATISMSDTALTIGETSVVTITFSEAVTGLTGADLTAANGTLSAPASSDEGLTWTATFTPTANVTDSSNVIKLANTGIADFHGNTGTGTTQSGNYTVDTHRPTPSVPVNPPSHSTVVDGTEVQTKTTTGADGSVTQVITIPTVADTRTNTDGAATSADIPLVTGADGHLVLGVGVPTGVGLQVSGATTTHGAHDALSSLIAAIQAHTATGSQVQQALVGGGSNFLDSLDPAAPMLVQTIVPTEASGANASNEPLVIRGAVHTDGAAQTALVIDASGLPSGAAIQLQNVEFAAVIGAVHLTGGDGSQSVWGDGASQYMVLGADDDVLHGGAGDDTVGSAGGNDQIFGDEGNDLVFGGIGNDTIDGGTGRDTVQLVGGSRADYTMHVADGKLVMTQRDGGADGTDTVSNVEVLRFTGVTPSLGADDTLARVYDTLLGRTIDQGAKDFWLAQSAKGVSMHDIAKGILNSAESQQANGGTLDNGAFVDAVYTKALDHTADTQGRAFWVQQLESGTLDRASVALAIVNSTEKLALEAATPVDVDFNTTDVASLVRLYDTTFGRAVDETGINFWIGQSEHGVALRDIATGFLASSEAQTLYGGLSNEAYIETLYAHALGHTASAAEVQDWTHKLDSGEITRGDALLGFADSPEKIGLVGVISTSIHTI
jgi:hypothetical protein